MNYYFSRSGNDNNNGTSEATPLKSLSKVAALPLVPGDKVLLRRGEVHRGTLSIQKSGTIAAPIVVEGYGTGGAPEIRTSQAVTGWSLHSGSIYKAAMPVAPKYVFQNGVLMREARFPNTGLLSADTITQTTITDAATLPAGNYAGAKITARPAGWAWSTVTIASRSGNTFTFPPLAPGLQIEQGQWGYFVSGKLFLLDQAGEWAWENGFLYLRTTNDSNPSGHEIEASLGGNLTNGIELSWMKEYVQINGLKVTGATGVGIYLNGINCSANFCVVENCYQGIHANYQNVSISNNTLRNTFATGITAYGNSNLINNNILIDIATKPGLGENEWGYFGIRATGNVTVIRNNRLDRIGYTGISCEKDQAVHSNVITRACHITNDGAGIAWDHCDGLDVYDNIITDCLGNIEGIPTNLHAVEPKCNGLYFGDKGLLDIRVYDNVCAYNNGAGIWCDHEKYAKGNTVFNNICYGNKLCQIGFSDYSNYTAKEPSNVVTQYNDEVHNNILVCTAADQTSMYHINQWYDGVDFGNFYGNCYLSLHRADHIVRKRVPAGREDRLTEAQWKAFQNNGSDALDTAGITATLLVYNDTANSKAIGTLPAGEWKNIYTGSTMTSASTLLPFSGIVLVQGTVPTDPDPEPPTEECTSVFSEWVVGPVVNGIQTSTRTETRTCKVTAPPSSMTEIVDFTTLNYAASWRRFTTIAKAGVVNTNNNARGEKLWLKATKLKFTLNISMMAHLSLFHGPACHLALQPNAQGTEASIVDLKNPAMAPVTGIKLNTPIVIHIVLDSKDITGIGCNGNSGDCVRGTLENLEITMQR